MRRIQIHLDEAIDDALAREALARHTSKAALIREYVSRHLVVPTTTSSDPSDALIASYEGTSDESARVDDVLYGR